MAEALTKNSILKFTPLLKVDGVLFWDLPELPVIEPQEDDKFHVMSEEECNRIDLIAYDYYKDPELWWVIMLANNKKDISQFTKGETIVIPSPNYVQTNLLIRRRK